METSNSLHSPCVIRIVMHHPSFIGTGRSPSCPWTRKNKKYLHARSLPSWFHVIECLEMKTTTKTCRRHRKEIIKVQFRNFKLYEVNFEHCNCTSHTSRHPRITHPHYKPNEPTPPYCISLCEQTWTFLKIEKGFIDTKNLATFVLITHLR